MVVNAEYRGRKCSFYYCEPACPQRVADIQYEDSVWRCGCVSDYIENIGHKCVACGTTRDAAKRDTHNSGHRVWTTVARLIFKTMPSERALQRLEDDLDRYLTEDTRFSLIDINDVVSAPAEDYGMDEHWWPAKEGDPDAD
jgi:hypothetical protein